MTSTEMLLPAAGLGIGIALGAMAVWIGSQKARLADRNRISELEARAATIDAKSEEREKALAALSGQYEAARAQIDDLNVQLRDLSEERGRLRGECNGIPALKIQLQQREAEATRLMGEFSSVTAQLQEANARVAAAEEARTEAIRIRDEHHAAQLAEYRRSLLSQLEEKQKAIDEQRALLTQAESRFTEAFDAASVRALRAATEEFLKLATARLDTTREDAHAQLAQREQAVEAMLKPLKETLDGLSRQCAEMEQKRVSAYDAVTDQINRLMSETDQLSMALRRPTVRGSWGEITLRTVADNAGLVEGQDYELQHTTSTDDGKLRADMVVRLPSRRVIVIDSKTPLDAYREAVNATDAATRADRLAAHARLVRSHVKQLSSKAYQDQYEGADYVIMFLPAESIYQAAMEHDPALLDDAVQAKVLLANPMTLIGVLKAVAYVLAQDRLNRNATEISEIGRRLYDGVCTFSDHMARLGNHLRQSVTAYNSSVGSLERSVFSRARQLQEKGISGGKELDLPESVSVLPDGFRRGELGTGVLRSDEIDSEALVELREPV